MPLTKFQAKIARFLAENRSPDSYLAGGAAIHLEPRSQRFSNDLDYFHDSEERVAEAFAADKGELEGQGYQLKVEMAQPGYIRSIVSSTEGQTKVEWSHDSSWRFLPTIKDSRVGFLLHPINLALNKVLALVGRDEPRDFLDTIQVHAQTLHLGALCWAAVGKDPGFSPSSLLELLKRRGKYRREDFSRLNLAVEINIFQLKQEWLQALDEASAFVQSRPAHELGCLYYCPLRKTFVMPAKDSDEVILHYGCPGGVLPRVLDS